MITVYQHFAEDFTCINLFKTCNSLVGNIINPVLQMGKLSLQVVIGPEIGAGIETE